MIYGTVSLNKFTASKLGDLKLTSEHDSLYMLQVNFHRHWGDERFTYVLQVLPALGRGSA